MELEVEDPMSRFEMKLKRGEAIWGEWAGL
jgi:hypothetical protein